MIELQAPLYVVKKLALRKIMSECKLDEAIKKYHMRWIQDIEDRKDPAIKLKEVKEKQVKLAHTIRKIDKAIIDLNFDAIIQINKVYVGLASDRDDYFTAN